MDEKLIYSLWDRFDRSDAIELVYESGDVRLKLRKAEPTGKQVYNGCITSTGMPAATFGVTMPQGMQQGCFPQTGGNAGNGNMAGLNNNGAAGCAAGASTVGGAAAGAGIVGAAGTAGTANLVSDSTDSQSADDAAYVRSPLPGTFYRSASPGDEPYVMIGSKVKQGDVVGIVESMKMMNEIVAPADGTVAEILAENGSIVGYDDKLIRLS